MRDTRFSVSHSRLYASVAILSSTGWRYRKHAKSDLLSMSMVSGFSSVLRLDEDIRPLSLLLACSIMELYKKDRNCSERSPFLTAPAWRLSSHLRNAASLFVGSSSDFLYSSKSAPKRAPSFITIMDEKKRSWAKVSWAEILV